MLLGLLGYRPVRAAAPWTRDVVLSQYQVKHIVADKAGFRWFATDEGVFRYDGYSATPLADLVRRGARLPLDLVSALTFDDDGRLWIGAASGLYCFAPAGRLTRIALSQRPDEVANVGCLWWNARTHRLWVGHGDGGMTILDPARQPTAVPPKRTVQLASNVYFFLPDPTRIPDAAATVWIVGTDRHTYQLSAAGQVLHHWQVPAFMVPLPGTRPLRMYNARALYEVDSGGVFRPIRQWLPPDGGTGRAFVPWATDSTHEWVAEGYRVVLSGFQGPQIQVRPAPAAGLPANHGIRLLHDPSGIWWAFATGWRGCYKQRAERPLVDVLHRPDQTPLPSTRLIARLPDGRLWVSTYQGAWCQVADSPTAALRHVVVRQIGGRSGEPILCGLAAQPDGRIWVAEETLGFGRLDPSAATLTFDGPGRHGRPGRGLWPDPVHHRLWGGSAAGLFCIRGDSVLRYAAAWADYPLHRLTTLGLAVDPDPATDGLWIATPAGLYYLWPRSGNLRHFGFAEKAANRRLPTDALLCVALAGAGRVWVGTRDQGLLLVDARRGLLRQVTTADGLPHRTVVTLSAAAAGHLWLGTYGGIVRYHPATGRMAVLAETEGLTDPELNRCAVWADHHRNALYFGGVGGVFRLDPRRLRFAQAGPPLRVLLASVAWPTSDGLGRENPLLRADSLTRLTMEPGAAIELELALSDVLQPEVARFRYQLFAADDTTRAVSPVFASEHRLLLRGLTPGAYVVHIQGLAAAGRRAANVLRVPIVVLAIWWQRPWVWAVAVALMTALGWTVARIRLARALREERLRTRIATDLHDEVGALMTRVTMQAQLLRATPALPPAVAGAVDGLLRNARAAAQTMRDVVWSIDAHADSVGALLDRMRDHLAQTTTPAGLETELLTANLDENQRLNADLRQVVYLIFKEAVTNVVRHAPAATRLTVRLVRQQQHLILEVTNDGFPAGAAIGSGGIGLRSMQQRAAAARGRLEAGPTPEGGWRVRAVLAVR